MKTLQIRDVTDDLHSAVKVRAAEADLSISDYLRNLLNEIMLRPTMQEIVERARTLAQAGGGASRKDILKAIREGRDR